MQIFKDSQTGRVYAFDDDVTATETDGVYSFACADGTPLTGVPASLQPYTVPAATDAEMLSTAQTAQKAVIDDAYAAAVQANVTFKTAAGVTETFEADATSQTYLMQTTQGYALAGATPSGFYWVAADNTQVAFTLADLQGLYQAILAHGWAAFQKRQALKASIDAATTVAAVQAIIWS